MNSVQRGLRGGVVSLLAVLLLTGCAGVSYNLPAVTDAAAATRLPGKIVWHDLISDDPAASAAFYSALFDWQFRSLPLVGAEYWLISVQGRPVAGMVNQQRIPAQKDISQWVSAISVSDVDAAVATVRESGGTVLREAVSLGDRGHIAVFADNSGGIFAVLQAAGGDPPDVDALPVPGDFLWHELWTPDVDAAAQFYRGLTGLQVETRDAASVQGAPIDYRVLRDATTPRSGLRSLPQEDMPTLWMPYLRIASRDDLDRILARVAGLGGQVLVPAVARPAGGFVAVIAGPSGAPIALQTWADGQPMLKEI